MSDYEKPCPFCGSTNLKSGGDDKIVGTWCLDCEATGPNHYGRYEWNDRVDRIEELEMTLAAALEMALTECPFRHGTASYNDWWHDRKILVESLRG